MQYEDYYSKREDERSTLQRVFEVQNELLGMTGEKLIEEFRFRCAETLLTAGMTLIPSDILRDHEFVVSNGVYEAAKKIISREK